MSIDDRTASPFVTPKILRCEFRMVGVRVGGMLVVATSIILAALAITAGAVIQAVG